MLKGIRGIMATERLSARVTELEAENNQLKEELSSIFLNRPVFSQVKKTLRLDVNLRDYIVDNAARRFEGVMDEHILMLAREAAKAGKPRGMGPTSYTDCAVADMMDLQVEVKLPEVRCSFRVPGAFR